ncbi:MAG: CBS domain-containing protein [Nitrospirota bacterium]
MAIKETTQAREHALPTTVYTLTPETSVDQAAYLMASRGVGNVVVVQGGRPVGILTDRDIVVRVTGAGLDARDLTVADVMSQPVITIRHDVDISHAVALMSRHGIRRLPIVDDEGALVSILTLDDLQMMGLSDRPELSGLIERQLHSEQGPPRRGRRRRAPPPVTVGSAAEPPPSLSGPVTRIARPSAVAPLAKGAPVPQGQVKPLGRLTEALINWFDLHLFWFVWLLLLLVVTLAVWVLSQFLGGPGRH